MENWKMKLSRLTSNTSIKKTIFTAFAVTALTFSTGSSTFAAVDDQLTTVYYVYLKGQYIGTVSDKNIVNDIIQTKLNKEKTSFQEYKLTVGTELAFVPEQVFHSNSNTNNTEVLQKLEKDLEVEAEAASIVIDGKSAAYVQNEAAAKEVIKKLKLQYVTEAQLNQAETRKNSANSSLPPLKENETRILNVKLSKNVSITDTKIAPEQILTSNEAVKLLQKGTLEERKYSVKEGDVLGSIAADHNLTTPQLLSLNPGLKEDSLIGIGDELNVTVLEPFVNVIVEKEVYKKETLAFKNEVVEDSSMFKGDTKTKQEGKNGSRAVIYAISEQNGKTVKKSAANEEVLQEPVNQIVVKGTKVVPSRGEGSFVWPTAGRTITSKQGYRWGKLHKGIDIARTGGLTIKAPDNGVVVSAGWDGAYGNKIVIDHQNGFRTVYAHLASINVKPGQTVPKGSQIAVMGTTGDSTGVHLHFELYKNGSLQDPLNYLP